MKKIYLLLAIVACFGVNRTTRCDAAISMFMRQYPLTREYTEKMQIPGKIASHTVHSILGKDPISGIFCTYAGYLDMSDNNGQVLFPRNHENPDIYLLITPSITPIIMAGATIHHWEIDKGAPARMYHAVRKQDDKTGLFIWDVQEAPLPEDGWVPLESILVFAKPKNIYVPTGIALTNDSPNLVLPDMYVKKGIKIYSNTLFVLNIRHFYGPLKTLFEPRDTSYSSLITY